MSEQASWIPITAWDRAWPSVAALRNRIAVLQREGKPVPFMRRIGRRVLVSPTAWDAWIEAQATPPASVAA